MIMKKNGKLSRRSFLNVIGAGLTGSLISSCGSRESSGLVEPPLNSQTMPMRVLGNTGLRASILSFGGGSRFLELTEGDWQIALENSLQGGINLFDTAPASNSYGPNGESEKRFGKILSEKYRDKVILCTKVDSRDSTRAESDINQSFQNLRTDVIDILQIHGLEPEDNLDHILGENGIWTLMKRLKQEGRVRFIGATVMHSSPLALEFAQRARPDVMLLAINAFTQGRGTPYADFEDSTLAQIRAMGIGMMSMKALRDMVGTGPGRMSVDKLLQYNWNLDISTALVGHEKLSELDYNIELAISQNQQIGLSAEEINYIRRKAKERKDLPCWMHPGYEEGRFRV